LIELEAGFSLDSIEVRPLEGMVAGPAGNARVEPKAMAVLMELARHAGEVCSREQVQQAVWPRGHTTDDVLTRCIGQLRKALGDDPKSPKHLETLPRRGYRLLSSPTPLSGNPEPAKVETDSLIVLPFQYLASQGDDYIADGMTELLTARLAALSGIRVISRTTAMRFKSMPVTLSEVARQTGAHWVVEGSVLQSGNCIQVVVQLVDARTDAHLWADDYVRDIGDMLTMQNEIAKQIAASIRVQLNIEGLKSFVTQTLSPDAMRDYLMGRHLISIRSAESLRAAVECFDRVCAAAPDYASAWASRAEARFMLCHYGALAADDAAPLCRQDADKALKLEPELAFGLTCRGTIRFMFDRDYSRASEDLVRAVERRPDQSIAMLTLANVYAVQEKFAEANGWLDQALLVDPLDVGINMNVGDHYILQRRFADAVHALDRALELAPAHRPSMLRRAWALALGGNAGEATAALADIGPQGDADWQWYEYAALVAGALGSSDIADGHWKALGRIANGQFVSPWSLARAAAAAGARKKANEWLERAIESGSTSVPFMKVTPAFDSIRDDEEYQDLERLAGFSRNTTGS
jgi:TolB-like protein